MSRRILILLLPIPLALAAVLSIRACMKEPHEVIHEDKQAEVVALRDGATMLAPKGTIGRDLIDWLAGHGSGQKSFELGGHQFIGRSAELTAESLGRIPRLATMLHSNPDVNAVLIGHANASGDPDADLRLGAARAEALGHLLEDQGISADRLHIETRGSAEPLVSGNDDTDRARNQRVTLILTRRE